MRYIVFPKFDDYPGFQPETTLMYFFAHDCSSLIVTLANVGGLVHITKQPTVGYMHLL